MSRKRREEGGSLGEAEVEASCVILFCKHKFYEMNKVLRKKSNYCYSANALYNAQDNELPINSA